LWAWGSNFLGDGTPFVPFGSLDLRPQLEPVHILDDVVSVYGTPSSNVQVITSNGNLWAWGNNDFGLVLDGTMEARYSPVLIMEDVVSFEHATTLSGSAGLTAITTDGSIWAFPLHTTREAITGFSGSLTITVDGTPQEVQTRSYRTIQHGRTATHIGYVEPATQAVTPQTATVQPNTTSSNIPPQPVNTRVVRVSLNGTDMNVGIYFGFNEAGQPMVHPNSLNGVLRLPVNTALHFFHWLTLEETGELMGLTISYSNGVLRVVS